MSNKSLPRVWRERDENEYDPAFKAVVKLNMKGGYRTESREGCPYYGDEQMMLKMCKDCIDMNCF